MAHKTALIVRILAFIGVGVLCSITIMVLQLSLSPQSNIKRVLARLNWPLDHAIEWYARTFHNGNADHLIPQGILFWGVYWLAIGIAVGLGGYGIWCYFAGMKRKR